MTDTDEPFKSFIVRFWDEEWRVKARTSEDAAKPFYSDYLTTRPKRSEVEVEEVSV